VETAVNNILTEIEEKGIDELFYNDRLVMEELKMAKVIVGMTISITRLYFRNE